MLTFLLWTLLGIQRFQPTIMFPVADPAHYGSYTAPPLAFWELWEENETVIQPERRQNFI